MTIIQFPAQSVPSEPVAAAERVLGAVLDLDHEQAVSLLASYFAMFRALGEMDGINRGEAIANQVISNAMKEMSR